ncbi:helix-turn-helix domain-containing protein [Flagellimonas lutimaris]|uniref:helix-turn-helix domain-containing protein n=1 Tax=Flagellimonas lutimaris TaxID=475082 RepID=UPI003F5CF330
MVTTSSSIKRHSINDILKILEEPIQADGLNVIFSKKQFKKAPFTYPFRSDNFGLLVVVSGVVQIRLNLVKHQVLENEIVAITPRTVIQVLEMEGDLEFIGIAFTADFILNNTFRILELDALEFFVSENPPKLHFTKKEMSLFKTLSKVLEEKNTTDNELFGKEIIHHSFGLLMYHYVSVFRKNFPDMRMEISRQEELTYRFLRILDENFKKERRLKFYADTLFITPDHLSKVLKEVSGKTASQWIDDAVMMEARLLLADFTLTIGQVAHELEFSDQSSFGKFFKKKSGISPSSYRKTGF